MYNAYIVGSRAPNNLYMATLEMIDFHMQFLL